MELSSRTGCAGLAGSALVAAALTGISPSVGDVPHEAETITASAGPMAVEKVADGLTRPWGLAFLPDGRLLITERPGRLRILEKDGRLSGHIDGTPKVFSEGQGGLLDVALDPDFDANRQLWLSFAEPGEDGASTALGRGRLENDAINGFETVFRQKPKVQGPNHFGGRIVFGADDTVFLTMADRFKFDPAQDLSNHLGTIVRIRRDGSVPDDNPFAGRDDARPEIWSYGHRNIQAAARRPGGDELWVAEMGPLGGDELNRIEKGGNYGWPVVSWGRHYDGRDIADPSSRPDFAGSVKHWSPVIAPSGMIFYDGAAFPKWRGSALIGALVTRGIVRLSLKDGEVADEELIPLGARIRDIEQGPDGALYLAIDRDEGEIWKMSPMKKAE